MANINRLAFAVDRDSLPRGEPGVAVKGQCLFFSNAGERTGTYFKVDFDSTSDWFSVIIILGYLIDFPRTKDNRKQNNTLG